MLFYRKYEYLYHLPSPRLRLPSRAHHLFILPELCIPSTPTNTIVANKPRASHFHCAINPDIPIMRVFSSNYTFDYSWNEVSTQNWRKYCPWNKSASHVIAVDTLSRHVDPSTGILRTERLITCSQAAPDWLATIFCLSPTTYSYETSYVDPASKRVTMCSTNLSWSNIISVRETVIYQPDESKSEPGHERTKFEQEARITALAGGWKKIKAKIEEATVEQFSENARRGREGFEMVLETSRRVFGEEKERERRLQELSES